jgi:uncharacterized protein YjbJ (UPF0337 family)
VDQGIPLAQAGWASLHIGGEQMGSADGKMDKVKGHAKEAMGEITDDDELKRKGKADRASGGVKEAVDNAKDKIDDTVDRVKDKLTNRD